MDSVYTKRGFTMVSNAVLLNGDLSAEARLTYIILKQHMFGDKIECRPGMARLAQYIGKSEKTVRGYIHELEKKGLITKKRLGLNRTNHYTLTAHAFVLEAGSVKTTDQEQHISTDLERPVFTDEEYEVKEDKCENHSVGSEATASTGEQEEKQESGPALTSGTTAFSGQDGSRCGTTAGELVSAVLRETGGDGRAFLEAGNRKNLLGSHFKQLLGNDAPTEDELAWVVQDIASWIDCEDEYLSPQRSLREGLRGALAPKDLDKDNAKAEVTDFPCAGCGTPTYWLEMSRVNGESLCGSCAAARTPDYSDRETEGSTPAQPAEGAQADAGSEERVVSPALLAKLEQLRDGDTDTARLAAAAAAGKKSPAGSITLEHVAEALRRELDLDGGILSVKDALMLAEIVLDGLTVKATV